MEYGDERRVWRIVYCGGDVENAEIYESLHEARMARERLSEHGAIADRVLAIVSEQAFSW